MFRRLNPDALAIIPQHHSKQWNFSTPKWETQRSLASLRIELLQGPGAWPTSPHCFYFRHQCIIKYECYWRIKTFWDSIGDQLDVIRDQTVLCKSGAFNLKKWFINSIPVLVSIAKLEKAKVVKDLELSTDKSVLGENWCEDYLV